MEISTEKIDHNSLLAYSSINVGDEIQSIAAWQYFESVNGFIHREQLSNYRGPQSNIFLNAWWAWTENCWPVPKHLRALPISMHIRPEARRFFGTPEGRERLAQIGPVGCRDIATLEYVLSLDVPACFSGCLTLTLKREEALPEASEEYILCVDVDRETELAIQRASPVRVISISRKLNPLVGANSRLFFAQMMLAAIQGAKAVVSGMLHVVLPSIALGTPVTRVVASTKEIDVSHRWSGYEEIAPVVSLKEIASHGISLSKKDRKLNSLAQASALRTDLERRASEFTASSIIQSRGLKIDPLDAARGLLTFAHVSKGALEDAAMFCSPRQLRRALRLRRAGLTKHSLPLEAPNLNTNS